MQLLINTINLLSVCRGGAETYAELHPFYESEKTQSPCSHTIEERQGPD